MHYSVSPKQGEEGEARLELEADKLRRREVPCLPVELFDRCRLLKRGLTPSTNKAKGYSVALHDCCSAVACRGEMSMEE